MSLYTDRNPQEKGNALDEETESFAPKPKYDIIDDLSEKERETGDGPKGSKDSDTAGIDSIREKEESGSGWSNKFSGATQQRRKAQTPLERVKAFGQKKGPLLSILLLLSGGGIFLGTAGTATMPFAVVQTFTNDTNDLNAHQQRNKISLWGHKTGGNAKDKVASCKPVVTKNCKLDTIPADLAKDFEDPKNGFKFTDKVAEGDRVAFTGIEFPDGEKVDTPEKLDNKLSTSIPSLSAWNKVDHIKNNIYNRGSWFSNILNKLGTSKSKKIKGDTKDEADKSFKEAMKQQKGSLTSAVDPDSPAEGSDEAARRNAQENNNNANSLSGIFNRGVSSGQRIVGKLDAAFSSKPASIGANLCLAYNGIRLIDVGAKTLNALRFIVFASAILAGVHAMMANNSTEAESTKILDIMAPSSFPSKIEDPDTGEMVDNPNIGKNITDSKAFQVVALGASLSLAGTVKRFFLSGGFFGVLRKVMDWIDANIGRDKIKLICKTLNNKVADVVSFLAAPVFSVAAMVLLNTVIPMDDIMKWLINSAIDVVAGFDFTNGIVGPDAGEVLFIGTVLIFGAAATKFGMTPGAFAAIKRNMADNHEMVEREVAVAKYDASKTPFDAKNQYSFLGSIAYQVAQLMPSLKALNPTTAFSKLLAAFPTSINMITKNANAAYNMPVANYTEERFSTCKTDEAAQALRSTPDIFCTNRFVPFPEKPLDEVRAYLKQTGQIDQKTSETITGKDTNLEKFMKYCVDREDPWGTSSVALEDEEDDTDWYTGKKCMEETTDNIMASNWVGYSASQSSMDMDPPLGAGGAPSNTPLNGDAKALALAVAVNPNIVLRPATKTQLTNFGNGQPVINECGAPMTVSKYLLSALLNNASKYKIAVNNIGFKEDRSGTDDCGRPTRQHPLGTAVDISSIQIIGGAGGTVTYPAALPVVNQYATDFLASLPPNRGGVGQKNFGVNPTFPPGSLSLDGSHLFDDPSGDHLHIDARNRQNLLDTE